MSDANRAELARLEAELRAVPEVHAVVTPLVSMEFSSAILDESVATQALARATGVDDDEASSALRSTDTSTSLARLSAARPADLANPSWVELILWDNTGYERRQRGHLDHTVVRGPPDPPLARVHLPRQVHRSRRCDPRGQR